MQKFKKYYGSSRNSNCRLQHLIMYGIAKPSGRNYPDGRHPCIQFVRGTDGRYSRYVRALFCFILQLHQFGHKGGHPHSHPHGHPHGATAHPCGNPHADSEHDLSPREIEVLVLITKGLINKEIADKLNISLTTVISHRKNITEKLGIKSVAGLTIYAVMHGYVEADRI